MLLPYAADAHAATDYAAAAAADIDKPDAALQAFPFAYTLPRRYA